MADSSHIHSSDPNLCPNYIAYTPYGAEDRIFKEAAMPNSLRQTYKEEVRGNIRSDFRIIKEKFSCQQGFGTSFGDLKSISVELASKKGAAETHYRGKVALTITFTDSQDNTIKIVYKPRNVQPDQKLEEQLNTLQGNRATRRTILPISLSHGYDSFVEGESLEDEKLSTHLIQALIRPKGASDSERSQVVETNAYLICALHLMGFEDIHDDNFILDKNGYLYFIDAECFCTKVSDDLRDIFDRDHLESEEDSWGEEEASLFVDEAEPFSIVETGESVDEIAVEQLPREISLQVFKHVQQARQGFHETLLAIPSRVVFFPSDLYAKFTPLGGDRYWSGCMRDHYLTRPHSFFIGENKIPIDPNTITFEELHTLHLGNFLHKHGFPIEGISIEQVQKEVRECFENPQALERINEEIQEVKRQNTEPSHLEVPVFHFDVLKRVLICDLTGEELRLKKGRES